MEMERLALAPHFYLILSHYRLLVYTQNQEMVRDEFGVASGVNTHRMKKKRTMF